MVLHKQIMVALNHKNCNIKQWFHFLPNNLTTFLFFLSGRSSCANLLHSCFLWSLFCFLITHLGMLLLFCGSCHGDKQVPVVGHFKHSLQMLCQMQVVHTGRIRQGRAQRWDSVFGHCLQLDRRRIRLMLCVKFIIIHSGSIIQLKSCIFILLF